MPTSTPHLQLYKPAGSENVNVQTDLNDNWDKVDAAVLDLDDLFEFGTSVEDAGGAGNGTFTSTTFTNDRTGQADEAEVVFVAPNSGKVKIHWTGTISNSTTSTSIVSFEVREGAVIGSGTVVVAASDTNGIRVQGNDTMQFGKDKLVTGLVGGNSYNVRLMYRVTTASTGTVSSPFVFVEPQWK